MDFASEIKQRVSTAQLCELIGLKLDRHGNALCPFHGDGNKSLKVYKDPSRGWTCFGCHRGGTVIDFAMLWYGIGFRQAMVRLDAEFGLGLPLGRKLTPEEKQQGREKRRKAEARKIEAENACKAAESSFWSAHDAYCDVLNTVDETRPKRGGNVISDAYAKALTVLPEIRDEFERAQYELQSAREELNAVGGNYGSPDRYQA